MSNVSKMEMNSWTLVSNRVRKEPYFLRHTAAQQYLGISTELREKDF